MNNQDVKTVTLVINSDQAQKRLDAINEKLDVARRKREEAFDKGDASALQVYTKEVRNLERQSERLQSRAKTVASTLRALDKATPKELKNTIKELTKELNSGSVARGSEEWNTLTRSIAAANDELKKINAEKKSADSLGDSLSSFGSKWMGLTTVVANAANAFRGAMDSMMNYVNDYAEIEEHMAAVRKYTGLDDAAVRSLNESFQAMDTRTARAQLNDLAGDAGRLGITSKQQILDFVAAADQINVALGEDLGEDAVKNIGKLAQLFGDADAMGLKQAMLSTGSVINELAQSSSASEGYLMEFTARLAGVGHQAGMTQAQVMAFGSILDQGMVNVEKGATALQNVITALYTNPQKMAKAAGLEVQQFTQLLKTDGNAAVLQFVQALQDTGGMDKLAPILKEMNLSGAGVTQTLSTLAANIDSLRATQAQATQAFREGTSVTNEFSTANNTVQARLEKTQQKMQDMRAALGEQLLPVAERGLSVTATAATYLAKLIPFLLSHARQLTALVAVIGTYTVAVNLAAIRTSVVTAAQKAWNVAVTAGKTIAATAQATGLLLSAAYYRLTGNIVKARAAQIALNGTLLSNPYAAVLTVVVAIASAVYLWCARTKELTAAQRQQAAIRKDMMEVSAQAAKSTANEEIRIRNLSAIINDNARSVTTRRSAINALQRIVPQYHASITREGVLINNNTRAINDYVSGLRKAAVAKAAVEQLTELQGQLNTYNLQQQPRETRVSVRRKRLADFRSQNSAFVAEFDKVESWAKDPRYAAANADRYAQLATSHLGKKYAELKQSLKYAESLLAENTRNIDNTNARISALSNMAGKQAGQAFDAAVISATSGAASVATPSLGTTGSGASGYTATSSGIDKAREAALDKAATAERAKRLIEYSQGKTDYAEFRNALQKIDTDTLTAKRGLYEKDSAEWKRHNEELTALAKSQTKQRDDWSIADINRQEQDELAAARERHARGLASDAEYEEQKHIITVQYLERRKALYAQYGDVENYEKTDSTLQDTLQTERIAKIERFEQQANELRRKYQTQSSDERRTSELNMLDAIYNATDENGERINLLSEDEYAKLKKQIEDTTDEGEKLRNTLGDPNDALSASIIHLAESFSYLDSKIKDGSATWQDYASAAVSAISIVSAMTSSASQLVQANTQLEQAQVTARYDAEIEAAGSSTTRGKKLEEQKQKELASIKTKYNNREMKIEIAQATAQGAQNAILAYGAMASIPIAGPALAAIAAAAALASAAIQIATIKKQHAAEAAGYYEGGFTGGRAYHNTVGVVHEGEFVANHAAVNNPNVLPVLQLIDHAQRTNRIASLTASDVSRAISAPLATASNTAAATQTVQVVTATSEQTTDTLNRLSAQLDEGIEAYVTIDGPDGLARQWRRYNKMTGI